MPKRVKNFPCGHKGLGAYCHRCHEAAREQERRREKRRQQEQLQASDPIDLTQLPPRIARKARALLKALANGESWNCHHGKRLQWNRAIISVPIGRDYRLLLRQEGNTPLEPLQVISHEDYNTKHTGPQPATNNAATCKTPR